MTSPKIIRLDHVQSHKTGELMEVTVAEITKILGFSPDGGDGGEKSRYNWDFKYRGHECAIWDWKGGYRQKEFSTFGPSEVFTALFGRRYIASRF